MNITSDVTPIAVVYSAFFIAAVMVFVGMILLT